MRKIERFGFWFTRREKSLLTILAASEESISQAAFLRRLLYQAAKSRGVLDIDHLL